MPRVRIDRVKSLRCPACLAAGRESSFEIDALRVGGGEDGGLAGDLLEAYLVCRECRTTYAVLSGVFVLPRDLPGHLATHGNVYRRSPIADPRMTRFVLGLARGGTDYVPFSEVLERYGDLLPAMAEVAPRRGAPADEALDDALRTLRATGPGLEVGCGVGRGTFVLAARVGSAVGVDRSIARVRRSRNVETAEAFHLPATEGARLETPIDLSRLARDRVDFGVADPRVLPFASGSFSTVVVRARDGDGAWPDADLVRREAARVAGPTGLVLLETSGEAVGEPVWRPLRIEAPVP